MMWTGVLVGALGCWLLKVAGMSVPPAILERPMVQRIADLIPVALLSALIAVQVFSTGAEVVIDARALGLGFAVLALVLRAPFLVVVFGAAAVAAIARLVT
jgi:Branched-chain amino acid transport protein (AzlD)